MAERSRESASEESGLWSLLALFPFCYVHSNHASTHAETKVVHLRSDVPEGHLPKPTHDLGEHDMIDTTLGPSRNKRAPQPSVMTPRQHCFKEAVQLPKLLRYPSLPKDFLEDGHGEQQERELLLKMFQDFVLDMHRGRYLTQLGSNQDYSVIHCAPAVIEQLLQLFGTRFARHEQAPRSCSSFSALRPGHGRPSDAEGGSREPWPMWAWLAIASEHACTRDPVGA